MQVREIAAVVDRRANSAPLAHVEQWNKAARLWFPVTGFNTALRQLTLGGSDPSCDTLSMF